MNTTTISPLTTKQAIFCRWLYEDGNTNPQNILFNRKYLRSVAMKHGMAWAPAWIVKDKTRQSGNSLRGLYSVPELATYIELINIPATAGNAT